MRLATQTDLAFMPPGSASTALQEAYNAPDWEFAYKALRHDYGGGWRPAEIIGTRQSRVQGKNLYTNLSEYDLLRQVDLARYLDASNPIAQGAVNKLVSFVLQTGANYKIVPKSKNIKAPKSYLTDAQDIIDEWRKVNKWRRAEKEHVRCAIVDGEIMGHKGRDDEGEPTIRRPEPEQLCNPPGMTELHGWRLGVQHKLGDTCKVLGYNINWMLGVPGNPDPYGQFVPASQIIHLKRNVVQSVARGVSDFFSNADDLDKIDRILDAMGAGTIARAKIAYFRNHKDALPGGPKGFRDAAATGTFYDPRTGREEKLFVPNDGTVADVPDTVSVVTMPQGNTLETIEAVGLLVRLCIANRWDMPENIASGDASNNNYASIMVAGAPFVIAIRSNQAEFADFWRDCMLWVIQVRMAQGLLPIDFLEYCDVDVTLPDCVINDELAAEQIRDIRFRNNILSPQTYSAQAMLDYDDELANKRQAQADDPQFAMDQMPGVDTMGDEEGNGNGGKDGRQNK